MTEPLMTDPLMTAPLTLRPLRVGDAGAMSRVLADVALYTFTGGQPPTSQELARRYAVQTQGYAPDGSARWVNSVVLLGPGREPIGYVQATVPVSGEPTEIAWVIGTPWQGRGYARRAVTLLLAALAAEGVGQVIAHIHPQNRASVRLATRLGFQATDIVIDGETRWRASTAPLHRVP